MQLTINGESQSYDNSLSVSQLLVQLGLDIRKVAFERNEEIVSRSSYEKTLLCDGDRIEIVAFIGGG